MTTDRDTQVGPARDRSVASDSVNQTAAQRSRELGYADAMRDIWQIARDLEKAPVMPKPGTDIAIFPPEMAFSWGAVLGKKSLSMLATYAFDAYLIHMEHGKQITSNVNHLRRYPAVYGEAKPELPG